jgi:lipoprotein-anchoring transpeptidase ErfK/SrfK
VARIRVSKDGFYLHALDESGRILYHFPTTVGAGYDPSPSGDFRVTGVAYDPDFHYQPKLFADVPDTDEDALLPPGPNSPVGLVWMQLSKDNYGIHGTAEPATIGYGTSHGCVRLTNWDALFLANRTARETPVEFTGEDGGSATQAGNGTGDGAAASP